MAIGAADRDVLPGGQRHEKVQIAVEFVGARRPAGE
jgi:hypothetical protein